MKKIFYKDLLIFTKKVLISAGLDLFSANSVATGLCETSLRGVDSHGIRLLKHYYDCSMQGRKNPKPNFKFHQKFSSLGVLDADNAFGHSAGMKAIDLCIKMAKKHGVGIVAVQNSSHSGAMASMALKASRKGYAAFAFTHADALMLAHHSKEKYFGTNPICFSCPRDSEEPFCLDMATSMISWNKLLIYRKENRELELNWAADKSGKSITNPHKSSSLMSAGSYKGFGLASVVEILCGVYTGMPFGPQLLPMFTTPLNIKRTLGQFYIVFRIDACISKNEFKKRIKILSDEIRKLKPKKGQKVYVPNDIQIMNSKKRLKNGIPLETSTYKDLIELSSITKLKLKYF